MDKIGPRIRVEQVNPLAGYAVLVTFENGENRVIDLGQYLKGPVFEPIRNSRERFLSMRIEGGTVAWDNGADIDPDVLYYNFSPAWRDEEEPAILCDACPISGDMPEDRIS